MQTWLMTARHRATPFWWVGHVGGWLLVLLLLANCARFGESAGTPATSSGTVQAVTGTPTGGAGTTGPGPIKERCGGHLEGFYQQMLDAPDPAAFARRGGLAVQDGRVEARISLAEDSAALEAELVRRYGLRVTSRLRTYVEGFIPIATICDLAQDPGVTSVGSPSRPRVWQDLATPTRQP